ncbi:MAG: DNA repair protein RecO [Planctomycetota bacterium]
MPYEKTEAILIRTTDFSETSRVFSFFTRRFGRITTLAKGAKRKYSRMIGQVDLFSYGEIVFASGWLRDRMHILAEACAFETFPAIRRDLARYYAASHAAALARAMTEEDDPDRALFDALLGLLRHLQDGVAPGVALPAFEAQFLVRTGFLPELRRCIVCGREPGGGAVSFSPGAGGIVCRDCSRNRDGLVRNVPSGALKLLSSLAEGRVTRLDRIRIAAPVARQVRRLLNEYETYLLARPLRTAKHL